MSRISASVLGVFVFFVILTFQNCGTAHLPTPGSGSTAQTSETMSVTGTVQKLNLDGCDKVIVSDAKSVFIPTGVDPASLPEGARVKVTGSVPSDFVSICMAGVGFKIDKIDSVVPPAP